MSSTSVTSSLGEHWSARMHADLTPIVRQASHVSHSQDNLLGAATGGGAGAQDTRPEAEDMGGSTSNVSRRSASFVRNSSHSASLPHMKHSSGLAKYGSVKPFDGLAPTAAVEEASDSGASV